MSRTSDSADRARPGPLRAGLVALEIGLVLTGLAVTGDGMLDTVAFEWTDEALARVDGGRQQILLGAGVLGAAAVLSYRRLGLLRATLIPLPAAVCAALSYAEPADGYQFFAFLPLALLAFLAVMPGGGERPWKTGPPTSEPPPWDSQRR